jgi:hypothetical protein
MDTPLCESPATGSITASRARVKAAVKSVVALCEPTQPTTLVLFEAALWSALLVLGHAAVSLFLAHTAARFERAATAHHCSDVATRFGPVPFQRPVDADARGRAQRPVDRALGLRGGASFSTQLLIARLCAQMAFGQARSLFAHVFAWRPSQDMTLRIVDAVGSRARCFLEQASVPEGDGEVLVLQVDARGAPMIDGRELHARTQPRAPQQGTKRARRKASKARRVRPRRSPGDKSKNARGAVVGVIYTLRKTETGWEGPVGKRLYATFTGHAALFAWLASEAKRRGYGAKPTLFLADGALTIWKQQQQHFPKAQVCLDWIHVVEKLWQVGACLHPTGSTALRAWVQEQTRRLRAGEVATVLRGLRVSLGGIAKTGPGTKARRVRVKRVLQYLTRNRHRLNYRWFRKQGFEIGTGVVEGAVRNLVGLRLDGPGMRWGWERAEKVLHLRCILLNEQWDGLESWLQHDPVLEMAPYPIPAKAYEAVKRAA